MQRSLTAALIILAGVAPLQEAKAAEQTRYGIHRAQLAEATQGGAGDREVTELMRQAQELEKEGKIQAAEALWIKVLRINETTLGPEHLETAVSLNNLALLYRNQGRYGEAEPLYKRSLAIREKALGPGHPDTATSLNNLAGLHRVQGRYGEAEPLYKRSLAIREKVLGPEHPDTAASLNNLALLYKVQGRYGEAEPLYKRSLAIQEKALGPEHPDTASSLNNLAGLYLSQGRYVEAEPFYKRSLAIREKVLGPQHPNTATSINNLAVLYSSQGRYGAAEPHYKRSLAISEKVLGTEHPDTAMSLNNLALLYDNQGRYGAAEPLYKRSLAIREKVLGPEHPDTASSLNNLAGLYLSQGRYVEAEPFYKRSLAIGEKVLGPEHPDTVNSLNNLAELYRNQGRYGAAEPLYKRSLAIREKVLGPEHPDTAISLNNLALLYDNQGRYGEAEPLYKRSLAIQEKVLRPEHPSTATSLNNLAEHYRNQGRYAEAEPLYKRSLTIQEKVLGPDHPDTAVRLNNLGGLYLSQGRYAEAEPLYKHSLAIQKRALGPEHPDTASSLSNLASLYLRQGRYAEVEPLYKRSLAIREKVLGPEHPDTANSLNNLAVLYYSQGGYAEAERLYKSSLAIYEKALGPLSPVTATSLNNLAVFSLQQSKPSDASPLIARLNRSQANWLRRELPLQPRELRTSLLAAQPDAIATTFALLHQYPPSAPLALETRLNRQGLLAEIEQRQRLLLSSSPQTRALGEQIAGIDRQLSSSTLPAQQRSALQQQRQTLEADLYRQLPALRIEPVSIPQVAVALPPRSALLEIQRYSPLLPAKQGRSKSGEPHYTALLLFPDQRILSIPLGPAAPLDAAIDQALKVSAEHKKSPRPFWLKVSNLLFQPLLPHLNGVQELFLSPDGSIHTVPFAALPSPANNDQYLSDSLRLRVLTTGRDLIRLQQKPAASTPPVVLANPDYGPPGLPWQQLPYTQREADQIATALGTTPITGSDASSAAVLKLRSPRILHIATHGFFQPPDSANASSDPLSRSGLAFSGANRKPLPNTEDAILTAAEATALQLNGTDIVVLSACQTGLGDVQSGEGVYGLQRALTVAGARSTLLSLWKVDDLGTALFMKTFYSNLLKGLPRADALAATQAAFRNRDDKFSDEHIWAAFQLTGDWTPIAKP